MTRISALAIAATLFATTASASNQPAVDRAIGILAEEGFSEVRVTRGPFGTVLRAGEGDSTREIVVRFGQITGNRQIINDRDGDASAVFVGLPALNRAAGFDRDDFDLDDDLDDILEYLRGDDDDYDDDYDRDDRSDSFWSGGHRGWNSDRDDRWDSDDDGDSWRSSDSGGSSSAGRDSGGRDDDDDDDYDDDDRWDD